MTTTTKFFKTVDDELIETAAADAEAAVELTFDDATKQLVASRWFTALEPGAATKEADADEDDDEIEWEEPVEDAADEVVA